MAQSKEPLMHSLLIDLDVAQELQWMTGDWTCSIGLHPGFFGSANNMGCILFFSSKVLASVTCYKRAPLFLRASQQVNATIFSLLLGQNEWFLSSLTISAHCYVVNHLLHSLFLCTCPLYCMIDLPKKRYFTFVYSFLSLWRRGREMLSRMSTSIDIKTFALEKDQRVSFAILWNVKCDLILDLPFEECPMPYPE